MSFWLYDVYKASTHVLAFIVLLKDIAFQPFVFGIFPYDKDRTSSTRVTLLSLLYAHFLRSVVLFVSCHLSWLSFSLWGKTIFSDLHQFGAIMSFYPTEPYKCDLLCLMVLSCFSHVVIVILIFCNLLFGHVFCNVEGTSAFVSWQTTSYFKIDNLLDLYAFWDSWDCIPYRCGILELMLPSQVLVLSHRWLFYSRTVVLIN